MLTAVRLPESALVTSSLPTLPAVPSVPLPAQESDAATLRTAPVERDRLASVSSALPVLPGTGVM